MPSTRTIKGLLGVVAAAALAGSMISSAWLATNSTAANATRGGTATAIRIPGAPATPPSGDVTVPSVIQTNAVIGDFAPKDKST